MPYSERLLSDAEKDGYVVPPCPRCGGAAELRWWDRVEPLVGPGGWLPGPLRCLASCRPARTVTAGAVLRVPEQRRGLLDGVRQAEAYALSTAWHEGGAVVLAVSGTLGAPAAWALLHRARKRVADGASRLVLDLSAVTRMEPPIAAALVRIQREGAEAGAEVLLAGGSPEVLQVLRRTGTLRFMAQLPTVEAALTGPHRRPLSTHTKRTLPFDRSAVALARALVHERCADLLIPAPVENRASDVVTALVRTALDHGTPPLRVSIETGPGVLTVRVHEGWRQHAEQSPRRTRMATGGLDLQAVERLAAHWGVSLTAEGTCVWAAFDLPAETG